MEENGRILEKGQNIAENEVVNAITTDAAPCAPTVIVALIDRSGSMGDERDLVIETFNGFLEVQKNQDQNGSAEMSIYLFDDQITTLCEGKPINDVNPLTWDMYVPRGRTSLLDALGTAIHETEKRQAGDQVIVTILTDGKDNSSIRFSLDNIQALIKEKELLGWDFVYLSADTDAFRSARTMGIRQDHVHVFEKTAGGFASSGRRMSEAVNEKRLYGTIGGWTQESSEPHPHPRDNPVRRRRCSLADGCGTTPDSGSDDRFRSLPRWRPRINVDTRRRVEGRSTPSIPDLELEFWRQLILRHPENGSRLHAHCFPNRSNKLVAKGSVPGTELIYGIHPNHAIVSFRIARENGIMNPVYERLIAENGSIEEAVGLPLEFHEGKRRYDEIRVILQNGGLMALNDWPRLHHEMIQTMERLESTLSSEFGGIKPEDE